MNTIASLIEIFGGPINIYASIENPPYMRLVIEDIGLGPRGYKAISVAHHFEQNGDLCQDPELGIELMNQSNGTVAYEPYFFQLAIPPAYEEVYPSGPGFENQTLKIQLSRFLKMWDKNLAAQGFVEAARKTFAFKTSELKGD
ncbi:MAG: hypothetical protein M3Y57_05670 [Acidobacteriota bacterium]|nr:hypothetical protein [Acidobacteriota bacterium]